MKRFRPAFCHAARVLAVLTLGLPVSPLPAAQAKESVLIDFTSVKRDPDGKVFKVYEYAFDAWDKHVFDLRGRGTLIKAATGKGGLGEDKTMVHFGKSTVVDLQFVVGNANQAQAVTFSLTDRDGSEHTWSIVLAGKPRGEILHQRLELEKAQNVQKPGTTPGLNLKKIAKWQVSGDWADTNVEVLLVKLTAAGP